MDNTNPQRVFAFGSGRSGTTFLAKLLDSSRKVIYRHEPDYTYVSGTIPFLPRVDEYPRYRDEARRYLAQLFHQHDPKTAGSRPIFDKDFRSPVGQTLFKGTAACAVLLSRAGIQMPIPDFAARSDGIVYVLKSVNSGCRVPLFAEAAPDIRFIHIVRHPGAVVSSLLRGVEAGKMPKDIFLDSVIEMPEAKRYPISPDEVRALSYEEQFAYAWMVQNDKPFVEMADKPNYLPVSYEDLCINLEPNLTALCEFAGIRFDAQMRAFVDEINTVRDSKDYFSVMRNPKSSLANWESRMSAPVRDSIASVVSHSEVGRFTLDKYTRATETLRVQRG